MGILWAILAAACFGANNDGVTPPPADQMQAIIYRGIRPTDPGGRDGLRNPERGLRIETLIAEPAGSAVWGPADHLRGKTTTGYSDDWWGLDAQRYEAYGLTLAQTYCYLDRFVDAPLSDEKLNLLRKSLARLRQNGLKALLRFAYEKDMKHTSGPTLDRILAHMDQLAPVIQDNADVIYVLQAGFVGAWGEWHNSTHQIENDHAKLAAIVAKLLEILPNDRMTELRVPKYKRWVLSEPVLAPFTRVDAATAFSGVPAARIGFHDDGFLAETTDGGTWPEPPHFANPGNPEFDYMTDECPYLPVDGELFWSDQGGAIDGLRAAERMRLHHYASFSIAHSYSEREGKPYSIDAWMRAPITREDVEKTKLPLSDGYFEDTLGNRVARTQFEYIRDHLGYRIELQRASFPRTVKTTDPIALQIDLINRGFAVMNNPRPVCAVLIDAEGNIAATQPIDADPRTWQPAALGDPEYQPLVHHIRAQLQPTTRLDPGSYMVGLWLPDASPSIQSDPRYAVHLANRDTPWWTNAQGRYGINILGTLELTP